MSCKSFVFYLQTPFVDPFSSRWYIAAQHITKCVIMVLNFPSWGTRVLLGTRGKELPFTLPMTPLFVGLAPTGFCTRKHEFYNCDFALDCDLVPMRMVGVSIRGVSLFTCNLRYMQV